MIFIESLGFPTVLQCFSLKISVFLSFCSDFWLKYWIPLVLEGFSMKRLVFLKFCNDFQWAYWFFLGFGMIFNGNTNKTLRRPKGGNNCSLKIFPKPEENHYGHSKSFQNLKKTLRQLIFSSEILTKSLGTS